MGRNTEGRNSGGVKQSAVVGRLGAPAIDCLIIGDLRRDVLGDFGCAQSDIKPIEYFPLQLWDPMGELNRT